MLKNSPKDNHETYRKQVDTYTSETNKTPYDFEQFAKYILDSSNEFAKGIYVKHQPQIQHMFTNSATFPDFFRQLSTLVEKKDKNKLYSQWLERFITSQLTIPRNWQYDISEAYVEIKNI